RVVAMLGARPAHHEADPHVPSLGRGARAIPLPAVRRGAGGSKACTSHVTTPLPVIDGPRDHDAADSVQRDADGTPKSRSQFGARRAQRAARTGAVTWRYDTSARSHYFM